MYLIQSKVFDNWFFQSKNKPEISFLVNEGSQVKAVYNGNGKCEVKYFGSVKEANTWIEFKERQDVDTCTRK